MGCHLRGALSTPLCSLIVHMLMENSMFGGANNRGLGCSGIATRGRDGPEACRAGDSVGLDSPGIERNIFDVNTTIDDEIIKSSRWPCTRSYADPVQGFEDQSSSSSAYSDETPTEISNGKVPVKKNS
ncbi:basic leucine-zipper 70 [Fagus crenata]